MTSKIDLKIFLDKLTPTQVIQIMTALGVEEYDDSKEDYIIFPTICHNPLESEASMKLYYYKQNKKFHCYTECGDTFNIFELVKRVFEIRNYNDGNFNFGDIVRYCLRACNITDLGNLIVNENKYTSKLNKFKRKNRVLELPVYDNKLLNLFSKVYPAEWLDENISINTLEKYNIRYSISQNKIIIPHYNINGELIGIRGRALNEDEVLNYGKYMPVKLEETTYSHPLSQALYGLNLTKDNIKNSGTVMVFEAEKSVLLYDTYFSDNISVAVCGSNFNKVQLDLLLKNTSPKEIVICFDKEYNMAGAPDGQKYFTKLWELCEKYGNYCHLSFIFDREQLLDIKDSPIDKGKEIFLKLLETRVKPWERIK